MCNVAEEEKRKFERFNHKFPALIQRGNGNRSRPQQFYTSNISSMGAFFKTSHPLEKGTKVKIEIILENHTLKKLTGSQCHIRVQATVIRREPEGMAVNFTCHKIMPMLRMMNN